MSFSILYERAGLMAVGDNVGTKYVFDFALQIDRVAVTALASPSANSVLDLVISKQLTGWQITVPSGVENTEVSLYQWFNPPITVPVSVYGVTPSLRWQLISGAPELAQSISQVDLVMYAERLV